jgi:hypothetical protein
MMHQYARLAEQRVHAVVGFYVTQHPDTVHTPVESLLKAFKDGINEDGLLDSHMPDLSAVMSRIPNTRQTWLSERLGIETMSRDLGDPNLFLTLNMDTRAWPDVRQLVHRLEHGEDSAMDPDYFEVSTDKYTELLDKYAVQISIYLHMKVKLFLSAFLVDICGVPENNVDADWQEQDRTKTGWYWGRVEFTETRGVQHWHCLAKLPNVLDTALLGRMIHNGRVVRQEIKCGNIRAGREEEAWTIVEMGLLANRYVTLFAESISQASFYTERMDVDHHDANKVINIESFRKQYITDYVDGNINRKTHPLMRTFEDTDCCDPNPEVENAKVASVSCMHHCITTICGGDKQTGKGCRFSFPMKLINHTVPAIMQVSVMFISRL